MANRLVTDIILNLSGNLAQKGKQYSQSMTKLGSQSKAAFAVINRSAKAASQGIDRYGNRMIVGAAAVGFAFERTFIKTAAEFERYQVMLNQLQGSEQGGAQAMQWIQDFTMNTPYAVNQVTQSFVKLKAFGLDPMDGTMQAVVDQVAMLGGTAETVDGISLAIGQMWTKGKIQGEEALQLIERGVPVWDYLAKASKEAGQNNGFGYTTQELQDLSQKGMLTKESIQALLRVMGEESKGAAKSQMDTWNGMVSNMGDTWTMFQKDAMDAGAFDALKVSMKSILSDLQEMKDSGEYDDLVASFGDSMADTFTSAHKAMKGFVDELKEAKKAGEPLFPLLSGIKDAADSIADLAGGYGNLAKAAATIYGINKLIRFTAPIANVGMRAGSWAASQAMSKGKGGKGVNAIAGLGATPVFVVNMPVGGFGGGTNSVKTNPVTKATTTAGKALNGARAVAGAAIPTYLAYEASSAGATLLDGFLADQIDGYREFDAKMTTKLKAFFGNKEAQQQDVEYFGADPEKYKQTNHGILGGVPNAGKQATPEMNGYLANQTGNLNVKVDFTGYPPKVKLEHSSPGITLDPDSGIN